MKHKPKKGVMPPALARYWRKHRRAKHHAKSRAHHARRKNSRVVWIMTANKGSKRLVLLSDGVHFSDRGGAAKRFETTASIRAHAKHLARQFPALRGYRLAAESRLMHY